MLSRFAPTSRLFSDRPRPADELLAQAARLTRPRKPFGLRVPHDERLAIVIAAAGVPTTIDRDNGVAHIRADAIAFRGGSR